MKLTLGFSPCPNDTFIFDAMVHHKIDTEDLEFDVVMEDVEELNRRAFAGELQVTKLSYHAYAHLINRYILLTAGSALGNNCGPLLIANKELSEEEVNNGKIVIPGKYTTANFLLGLAYPKAQNKIEVLFSEIEDAVLSGKVDAGLVIHETRFTYHERGLVKIMDLGEFWEGTTGLPIPLGGIVVKRNLSLEIQQKINRVMEKSVRYALENPSASIGYVKKHAQEMDEEITHKHINLYVNSFTLNLGLSGKSAVDAMFKRANELNLIPSYAEQIFIH